MFNFPLIQNARCCICLRPFGPFELFHIHLTNMCTLQRGGISKGTFWAELLYKLRCPLRGGVEICASFCVFETSYYSHLQKFLGQTDQSQQESLGRSNDNTLVSELAILDQKSSKIASRKRVYFWVFANHPDVHSERVNRGRFRGSCCWR